MREAIDYNALSWVRHELAETLKQARLKLEAYANNKDDSGLLHECVSHLHEARGPLQMVELRGADRLAAEVEEVLSDLLQSMIEAEDASLELLMQALLQLPDYLSSIHSGQQETPAVLLPVINELRASRGAGPLQERAFFSPNLSVQVPTSVYNPHSAPPELDLQEMARSARLRFQAGLLEWYRGGEGNSGLQALAGVLEGLLQCAGSEPAARVWWVGAGLADAMVAGELPESPENKQLFGQLDRQIKRLLDSGEGVFTDALTDELLVNLLFGISRAGTCTERVDAIKSTYGLNGAASAAQSGQDLNGCMSGVGSELLQTVSGAVAEDIGRIKEQLDIYAAAAEPDATHLLVAAAGLHALANTLDMVGLGDLCADVAEWEQRLRMVSEHATDLDAAELGALAVTLVAVEDAVQSLATEPAGSDAEISITCLQGLEAVTREVLADIARAKEAINEFSITPAARDTLAGVPGILDQVSGSLQLAGEERAASIAGSIGLFISRHMLDSEQDNSQLEPLADAVCSVEYYVEGLVEGGSHGDAALREAEQGMDKLSSLVSYVPGMSETDIALSAGDETVADIPVSQVGSDAAVITGLQVIATDADEEILSIFIEEAEEQLAVLREYGSTLLASSGDTDVLTGAQRAFHTIKGSGRMLGALAIGEFAWIFENLLNRVLEGVLPFDERVVELLDAATGALELLLQQLNGAVLPPGSGVDVLALQAIRLSEPDVAAVEPVAVPVTGQTVGEPANAERSSELAATPDLPVLSTDADEEIVEIFLEEAAEQAACIAEAVPVWISNPEDGEVLAAMRRSFHTLKGSGRMAGAMLVGEFSWTIEDLLNRLLDGSVQFGDSVAILLGQCGEALSQLITQVQDTTVPALDIQGMMACAAALARGEAVELPPPADGTEIEAGLAEPAAEDAVTGELSLLEVFSHECRDHLAAIHAFLEAGDDPCVVTESLYRALHTLSGISESAEIDSIQGLAGDLNTYFDELYQLQQPVSGEALHALRDAAIEIHRLVDQLPDLSIDETALMTLRDRIPVLPSLAKSTEDDMPEAASEDVTVRVADVEFEVASDTDPYAGLDPELYEIFIEESSELIDSGESVLRSWSEDPGNPELLAEFQRQLHTLKGGARMVDVPAVGDLSHAVESLLVQLADGTIVASDALFALLHASHDRLAEMLERVKARELPVIARDLEQQLEALAAGQDPVVSAALAADEAVAETAAENVAEAKAETETETETETDAATVPDSDEGVIEGHIVVTAAVTGDGDTAAEETACTEPAAAGQDAVVAQVVAGNIATASAQVADAQRKKRSKPSHARGEQVRVQSGVLDDMVNHAGEINIYRTRMEQQISDYRFNLAELDQTISRLREQLRQLEMETEIEILFRHEQEGGADSRGFDPLELDRYSNMQQLSRSLMESISDLRSLQGLMETTTRESETLLLQQSRVSTDLQEGLMRTRMIPFAGLAPRLRRIVRQTARQMDKKAELELQGGDGEIDRTVIDRIVAPLEHMLRNAVAHGIESPQTRNKSGKSETGNITVSFEREGPEIVLRIADDGAGMNIEAIRERAIERGLMTEDAGLKDEEIIQFVQQTGFSTASDVTQISGRGVGMDVVNSEVRQLGGSLHIESTANAGSVFTLRLPYTLAINQVLLVSAGEQEFCIPLGSIEGVVRATPQELAACYAADEYLYGYAGNWYELKHLGSVLGTGGMNLDQFQERVPVLLARVGGKRMALQVESLLGSREIVIKPVGVQLSSVDGISGATILGDGRVVLILDMAAVARMNVRTELSAMQAARQDESRIVIMVVDDSITVRKVTTRLLERNGFKVLTAKDGVDALGQLQHAVPDMMLLDIEMPRMDGFELATHMRNDAALRHVPIIMITSRTGDKHRRRAQEIGVNNYLGKPYQENDLLESIHHIIGVPSARG